MINVRTDDITGTLQAEVSDYVTHVGAFMTSAESLNRRRPNYSQFVETDACRCYLRYGKYAHNGAWQVNTLVIASIELPEALRGRGFTRALISRLHNMPDVDSLVVECVNEPILAAALQRWGFIESEIHPGSWIKINIDTGMMAI